MHRLGLVDTSVTHANMKAEGVWTNFIVRRGFMFPHLKTKLAAQEGLKNLKSVTKSSLPTLHLPIPTHLRLQDWSHLELMLQTLFCLKHQIGNNCYFLTHFSNSFYFSWGFLQLVCSWSKNVSNMHPLSSDLWKVKKKWNGFKKLYLEWKNLI